MKARNWIRGIFSLLATSFIAAIAHAAPLSVPANAIPDDTFCVGTLDLTKVEPARLEATAKASLGEKAGDLDELLGAFKTHHEKFADKGVERVTVVFHGDPDKQREPQPVFYVKLKPDADHTALEKQIREEEGQTNPSSIEISNDGEFMVLRGKGIELPAAGSEERAKLFAEVLGGSDQPAVMAFIFTDTLIQNARQDAQKGMPPGLVTLVTDSKWVRIDLALGDSTKAEVTIETTDADSGKGMADAVTSLAELMKAQIAVARAAGLAGQPQLTELADVMTTITEAMKPEQSGAKVSVGFDAKAVGAMLRGMVMAQKMSAQNGPGNAAGL